MKKLHKSMPSERQVLSELRRVSHEYGVRVPSVRFRRGLEEWSEYLPDEECVCLASPDVAREHQWPAVNYWVLVYHELAHHIAWVTHGDDGHCAQMYAILVALVLESDLPLDAFFVDEKAYRPRAFSMGRMYAGKMLARLLTASNSLDTVSGNTAANPAIGTSIEEKDNGEVAAEAIVRGGRSAA